MARPCDICRSNQCQTIDKLLISGEPATTIAKTTGESAAAIRRHWRNHGKKKYSAAASLIKTAKTKTADTSLLDGLPPVKGKHTAGKVDVNNTDNLSPPDAGMHLDTNEVHELAEVLPAVIDINKALSDIVQDTKRYQRMMEGDGDIRGALAASSELRKHLESAERLLKPLPPSEEQGAHQRAELFLDKLVSRCEGNPELRKALAGALADVEQEIH